MYFEEDNYDKFNKESINNLNKLNYNFVLDDRFIYVTNEDGEPFMCQTPFLKILKPIHATLNKKKTIAKKYIILETNDELDFNNQIGEFIFVINKIHETSQEKIKEKSLEWFNTEFDDIGLDIKVRRPIDQQKDNEFIRIAIPKDENIETEISNLEKGSYLLCNIIFKGLKISSDYITEEWEIKNFITQEKYDQLQTEEQNEKEYNNSIVGEINDLLEETNDDIPNELIPVENNDVIIIENNIFEEKKDIIKKIKTIKKNKKQNIDPIKKSSKKLIFT